MIKNTQNVKKNAFSLEKTRKNMRIFEEVLFFKATYNTKTNKQFNYLLPVEFLRKEEETRLTY